MVEPLTVPVIPNRPLLIKNEKIIKGKILLRHNKKNGFVENFLFNEKKIKKDLKNKNINNLNIVNL